MGDPTIPPLALANDHSAMGIDNDDTYGLHFEIDAQEDWVYVPEGRFPAYDAQILISILIGTDEGDLCASQSAADDITFIQRPHQSTSAGTYSSQTRIYSWIVTIDAVDHVIIGKKAPVMIDMSNIKPNDMAGVAQITLLPRLKAKRSGSDINGHQLSYSVEKTSPPIVINDVVWSNGLRPGRGQLTWQATGEVKECTLKANGEEIGQSSYRSGNSQYEANLILEMGTQSVDITAADQNHNTATNRAVFAFPTFNPYFVLQVSNGLPLSLVISDQQAGLYGVFSNDQSGIQVWENTFSGTQDNWQNTGLTLKSGYESSPCVYYHSSFYLLGGSMFDFRKFQNQFWIFRDNDWQSIPGPDRWNDEPRIGQAVALFAEAIWIAGGYGASGQVYTDVYSYSDHTGWKQEPDLPHPLCNASLAAVGNQLYLFGGYSDMPGGAASATLYSLSDGSSSWVLQNVTPRGGGSADYWALGSVGGQLLLLASFDGSGFTGRMSGLPHWQGGDENFSDVARGLGNDRPPYGFITFAYGSRLFLMIATSGRNSVFAYYDPSLMKMKVDRP